jgi:Tfp pilus assembly protein PilX
MTHRHRQAGITLVVSLIMLVVLTLLVVAAIRFGNINLRISGNAQTEAEATAATQVAIETILKEVVEAEKIDTVQARPAMVVSTGRASYTVNVSKPACILTKNVPTTGLDPTRAADKACIEDTSGDPLFDKDGKPVPRATACKDQQWEIAAAVADPATGAQVSMLQGVSLRVGAQVQCP